MKKTITVGDKNQPTWSLLRGRVSLSEFNTAYKNEGWDADGIKKDELLLGFFRRTRGGGYIMCDINKPIPKNANLYTYIEW